MMLQKLPTFLKENNAKLLIKYDGERNFKKYTIRIFFDEAERRNVGCDTDSPYAIFKELFNGNDFFEEEMSELFMNNINVGIETLKDKFGDESIISVIMNEKDSCVLYTIHIQTEKGTKYLSDTSYKQLYQTMLLNEI